MYRAFFDPQAWINDEAVTVDAEGEQTWDCTAFVKADATLKAKIDKATNDGGDYLDRDDVLFSDPAAPEWVKKWDGPFTITVEKV